MVLSKAEENMELQIAQGYFQKWEIEYAREQKKEEPWKVLKRFANDSARGWVVYGTWLETWRNNVRVWLPGKNPVDNPDDPDISITVERVAKLALQETFQPALL
jgi:hypothetical protein